jgi:hypothetical protein
VIGISRVVDQLTYGLVALIVGWSLLTDSGAIKLAGVPILRSLNIPFRLKQQALMLRDVLSLELDLLLCHLDATFFD